MSKRAPAAVTPNVTVKVSAPSDESSEGKAEPKTESQSAEQKEDLEDIAVSEQEAAPRAVAWIYRRTISGNQAYLGEVRPRQVSQSFLLNTCGGGIFDVEYRVPSDAGGTVRSRIRTFYIDESVPPKTPPWAAQPGAAVPASGTGAGQPSAPQTITDVLTTGVLTVIKSMQDASTTNAQLLQASIDRLRTPEQRASVTEIVTAVSAALAPLITAGASIATAIISRERPAPPDPMQQLAVLMGAMKGKDPMEMAIEFAKLTKPEQKAADPNSMPAMMETLKGMVSLSRMLNPNGGGGDGAESTMAEKIIQTVGDVAKAVPETMRAMGGIRPPVPALPPGGPLPAPPVTAPVEGPAFPRSPLPGEPFGPPVGAAPGPGYQPPVTPVPPTGNGVPQGDDEMLRVFLAPISADMLERARDGDHAVLHAQALLDRYKRFIPEIAQWVERPNCIDEWLAWFPDWNAHPDLRRWLEEFIVTIDKETHEQPAQ